METMQVRPATLDDTQAISALFRSRITTWQRLNPQGQVEDVPYTALTIYERWLHGGPWMSVETGALQLSHLLRGAGMPVVAETNGQVRGYSEAYHGVEPEPFGDHLHIAHLTVAADGDSLKDAMLGHWREQAPSLRCRRVTATCAANDADGQALYERHGLSRLSRIQRFSLPARTGQVFYKATDHPAANPSQINGWYMQVGRFSSARQQWETLWPRTWYALPELRSQRAHRLHFLVAGQEAYVYCQQQLYEPRSADVYCWTPKPFSSQVLTAIRDWAHREGYRTLVLAVPDETVKLLGNEAEPDGYIQDTYAVTL
ncbi:MAG: hypothetical protein HZC41_16095 [Chloroflexi bacterium]|nr:hypothetical protein [Chloroflexota bacterium]